MIALGFISLFLPAQHIGWDDSVDWAGLVAELVSLFPVIPSSSQQFWSTLVLNKLAALRKHDIKDRGGWDAHGAAIMTQVTARFELPIGNAQGAPPFTRATPTECRAMFMQEAFGRPVRPSAPPYPAQFVCVRTRRALGRRLPTPPRSALTCVLMTDRMVVRRGLLALMTGC